MTKIKIGLFGFGVVGQGIYEVVRKSKNAHAEIVKICTVRKVGYKLADNEEGEEE